MTRRKAMTAHEFLGRWPEPPDPAVRARLAREKEERRRRELEYKSAEEPLLAELRSAVPAGHQGWHRTRTCGQERPIRMGRRARAVPDRAGRVRATGPCRGTRGDGRSGPSRRSP